MSRFISKVGQMIWCELSFSYFIILDLSLFLEYAYGNIWGIPSSFFQHEERNLFDRINIPGLKHPVGIYGICRPCGG